MIGKAYWAIFKYYNGQLHKMAFKKRPVLVIGRADSDDYVVLPISRVTRREHLDQHYDFEIQAADYPQLCLKATSYIRTHKQTVVNEGELSDCMLDFREKYPDAYVAALALVEEFQRNLINRAF